MLIPKSSDNKRRSAVTHAQNNAPDRLPTFTPDVKNGSRPTVYQTGKSFSNLRFVVTCAYVARCAVPFVSARCACVCFFMWTA